MIFVTDKQDVIEEGRGFIEKLAGADSVACQKDKNGIPENAAVLEVNGHEVLIVDIDRDGIADAALCDVDNDGQIKIADLSGQNITMPEQSAGDAYMAQVDTAPDYLNDANVGMYEA